MTLGEALRRRVGNLFKPMQVAIIGLDNAGKTCLLYRIKYQMFKETVQTCGFNCETVRSAGVGQSRKVNFCLFDVAGHEKLRPLWKTYTRNCDGIVFVVDSADQERLEEARLELIRMAKASASTPFIVVCNKQDLPAARTPADIASSFQLADELDAAGTIGGQPRPWALIGGCAITGEGYERSDDDDVVVDDVLRQQSDDDDRSSGESSVGRPTPPPPQQQQVQPPLLDLLYGLIQKRKQLQKRAKKQRR